MLRSGISGALDAAILRALAKDKDERWQSAHDFAAALAALPEGSGVLALRSRATKPRAAAADPGETARLRPERRWRRLGVLLALLLATAVGAWFAVAQGLVDLPAMPWLSGAAAEPDAAPRRAAPPPAPRPPDAAPPDAQLPDAGPPRDGGVSDAGSVDATVPVDVAR
jgi:serine/threonine-protein kinase